MESIWLKLLLDVQVKPGLPYLDIIRLLRDNSPLPIAAYQVLLTNSFSVRYYFMFHLFSYTSSRFTMWPLNIKILHDSSLTLENEIGLECLLGSIKWCLYHASISVLCLMLVTKYRLWFNRNSNSKSLTCPWTHWSCNWWFLHLICQDCLVWFHC